MRTIDMNVSSEGDLEAFLTELEDTLATQVETAFELHCPHPGWANIILDNVEGNEKYQCPEGVEPFVDCTFVFPPRYLDDISMGDVDPLDTLQNLLEQLRDALDEEEGDNDE